MNEEPDFPKSKNNRVVPILSIVCLLFLSICNYSHNPVNSRQKKKWSLHDVCLWYLVMQDSPGHSPVCAFDYLID